MSKQILFFFLLTISLFLLLVSFLPGQENTFYNLNVNIDTKAKLVSVKGNIDVDFHDKDTLNFVLWKYSIINGISGNNADIKYSLDTLLPSPIMYIPQGGKLTLIKPKGASNNQCITFDYTSNMQRLNGWAKSFTEDWIELNFYSAWFPVALNGRNCKSKLNIYIDKDYSITGSGVVLKKNTCWEMSQSWSGFDNVIIASRDLKSRLLEEEKSFIQTYYSEFPDTDADSILAGCKSTLNVFKNIFGIIDSTYLKFIIAPFEQGGGYSRKNFVRMGTKHFNLYTAKGIAHEIAHFWWNKATTTSWEDWLNEAFAEYSMLLYIRERYGEDVLKKQVEDYKSRTKNLPPIWGINRNSNDAYSVLYEKGSLILNEMECMVGKDKFFNFLKKVSENKISTTNDLLNLIEENISKDAKQWLENKLKTA